jgi:hypothetical protein
MSKNCAAKVMVLTVGLLLCSWVSTEVRAEDAKRAEITAPRMEFVYEETVTLGASIHPGATPLGERNIVPITGGTFTGPRLHGKILPGGWDWQLSAKSGCFFIQANYIIQTDDGAVINVDNRGRSCPKDPAHRGPIYTTPVFEAPLGAYQWLNGGAYVGTLDVITVDGKPAVHIRFFRTLDS